MPQFPFTFDPFRRDLYTHDELFFGFERTDPTSYARTRDFAIYREYIISGKYAPTDYFTAMMESVHDNAITQALSTFLKADCVRPVAVMGGHQLARGSAPYNDVVALARVLTRHGFSMLSGGGPGAMEATHLGALFTDASEEETNSAIAQLKPVTVPDLTSLVAPDGSANMDLVAAAHEWFSPAFEIATSVGCTRSSISIPTWLYGHEPSTPFATKIAKYFQNSIREDGLLAVATCGVVFVEGRGGTLQEIFQDAAQNYYRTFGAFSPMVFLGEKYWTQTIPAIAVLQALFKADDFARYVRVTDDVVEAAEFIEAHAPQGGAAERMVAYLTHEVHGREDRHEAPPPNSA